MKGGWKVFLRLLAFSKPYGRFFPQYTIYVVLFTVFNLLNFTLIIPLLNFLFNNEPVQMVARPAFEFNAGYFVDLFHYYSYRFSDAGNDKYKLLVFVVILLLAVTILKNLFNYLRSRVMSKFRTHLVMNVRNALFLKLTNAPLGMIQSSQKGQLLSIISNDVGDIEQSIASSIEVLFKEPLIIIVTFIALFYISPQLTLFTLLVFPLSGLVINWISKQLKRHSQKSQHLLGALMGYSEEMLTGNRVIKIFNAEKFVNKRYQGINNDYTQVMTKMIVKRDLASPFSEVMGIMVIAVIILYGGYLILNQESNLNAATFIGYLGLYFSVIAPARNIGNAIAIMQKGVTSGERILNILDEPEQVKEFEQALQKSTFDRIMEFDHVSFHYNDNANVLSDINIRLEKGKTLALVGESGAGKSSLIDLIPRFYDVTEGRILIDNVDIRHIKKQDLREMISMVTQEPILFNDTIYNNITFGRAQVTPEAVYHAAKIANAHQFIIEMEEGYETMIGDRGSRLSGGQRQRITIARAVLKDSPIIILDEATSALDTESEKLVQEALQRMLKDRTSIIIAHRLSTIQHADEIIVLQRGKIVEQGNHSSLIAAGGLYHKLVSLQSI